MEREREAADGGLLKKAALCRLLSVVLIAATLCMILVYRNPWLVHRMNADQATEEVLEQIVNSPSPYIKLDNMELSFTGYYKVGTNGKVYAYCYLGTVGDQSILVSVRATDDGALAEDETAQNSVLSGYTLQGQLVIATDITDYLAASEGMTTEDYKAYYGMAAVELRSYGSDQEQMQIYQLMLLVLAVAAFVVGQILRSEAKMIQRECVEEVEDLVCN